MSKYQDTNRWNITTIIHDLKESYSKAFHEKMPISMEEILIKAAREVKKGFEVEWTKDETGNKNIYLTRRRKSFITNSK